MGVFERYLSVWVLLGMIAGTLLGYVGGETIQTLGGWQVAGVNVPVAILIWLMIYPMMVQIDFSAIKNVSKNSRGLGLTIVVNWIIKPFSMAFFAWLFFSKLYHAYIDPKMAEEYIAGAILLGAAPCTAMVFVWSYLTKGDANYTLVQVAVNDLILLIAFVPIVTFLLGVSNIQIPSDVLLSSVIAFVVIPLIAGIVSQKIVLSRIGKEGLYQRFIPSLKPISIVALLSTLVLLFAFQGRVLVQSPLQILLIAIPLTLQTYVIFFITWFVGRKLRLAHPICGPAAMIGSSNFFELAVAVAIALFGLSSGAALVTVVGVLIEVPVMLSLVALVNKWKY